MIKRSGQVRNRVLFVSTLILLITIVIPTSAMWGTRLKVNVSINTGSIDPGINSFRGFLVACNCHSQPKLKLTPLTQEELHLGPNGKSLILQITPSHSCCNGTSGKHQDRCREYVVIGVIVKNYGSIPVNLINTRIQDLSPNNSAWSFKVLYYGPLRSVPPSFWNALKTTLTPPGNTPSPIPLDPGELAIILLIITIQKGGSYQLSITPIFAQFNK